jgi:hypothetical protein
MLVELAPHRSAFRTTACVKLLKSNGRHSASNSVQLVVCVRFESWELRLAHGEHLGAMGELFLCPVIFSVP